MRKMGFKNWSFAFLLFMLAWLLPSAVRAEGIIKISYKYHVKMVYIVEGSDCYVSNDGKNYEQLLVPIFGIDSESLNWKREFWIKGNIKKFKSDEKIYGATSSVVLENCDQLEEFELHHSRKLDEIVLKGSTDLKSLKFNDCGNDADFKAIQSPVKNIENISWIFKTLEFTDCNNLEEIVSTNGFRSVKAINCAKLTKIGLHSSELKNLDLTGSSNVKSIDISGCNKLKTLKGLESLQNSLQTVNTNNCSNLTTINCKQHSKLETLEAKNCGKLETVEVNGSQLTKLDLTGAATKSLDLSNCTKLTTIVGFDTLPLQTLKANNSGLRQIAENESLEDLEVEKCSQLTTIKGGKSLKKVKANNCSSLTAFETMKSDNFWYLEAKNCGKLEKVGIRARYIRQFDLSNSATKHLDLSNCPQLEKIGGFASLPLVSLKLHTSGLWRIPKINSLQTLKIEECHRLDAIGVGESLQTLLVSGCGNLYQLFVTGGKNLRSLTVNRCWILNSIEAKDCENLEEVEVAGYQNRFPNLDVSRSKKLKKIEASLCREINAHNCEALETFKVEGINRLVITGCPKLTKIEGDLTYLVALECNQCGGFSADYLKSLLDGSKAPNLGTYSGAGSVMKLPPQLKLAKSLNHVNLEQNQGLTSLTVSDEAALEELILNRIKDLKEINVSAAKSLKKLYCTDTDVKKIRLAGLKNLEYVYLPAGYPATLLTELICQLPEHKSPKEGVLKYPFATEEKKLVNGKEAKAKNWKILNNRGDDVTADCTHSITCSDIELPTTPDEVQLAVDGKANIKLKFAKASMLWFSKSSDKTKFFDKRYFQAGEHNIEVTGDIYLFAQPSSIANLEFASNNEKVKSLKLTKVPALERLILEKAEKITQLDLTQQGELKVVKITKASGLTKLDISKNSKLTDLEVTKCGLVGEVDLSKHAALRFVDLEDNKITSVKLGKALTYFRVPKNQIEGTLDVSSAVDLKKLVLYENRLTGVKLADNKSKYEHIDLDRNALASLDLQNMANLEYLYLSKNENLGTLDLRGCARLRTLAMDGCKAFKEIQVRGTNDWFLEGCTAIKDVYIQGTSLNANQLNKFYCNLPTVNGGNLRVVDLSNADNLREAKNSGTSIANAKGWKVLANENKEFTGLTMTCDDLVPHDVPEIELSLKEGETTVKFKSSAKELWIEESEGHYDYEEVEIGEEITRQYNTNTSKKLVFHGKISSFEISNQATVEGLTIKDHPALTELLASHCSGMQDIELSNVPHLTKLIVNDSKVKELALPTMLSLKELNCANNNLKELNLVSLTDLSELNCANNLEIKELDLVANINLEKLHCEALSLTTLDLTTNAKLNELVCYGNKFTTVQCNDIYCTLPSTDGVMIAAKAKVAVGTDPNYDALVASSSQLAKQKSWKVLYEDKSEIETTGTVSVCRIKPAGITIAPLFLKVGESKQLKYTLQPEGATAKVTFKSKDESIAKVDAEGNVTGVKEGKVTIEVTPDVIGLKGVCNVTVEKPSDVQDAFFASVRAMPNPFNSSVRIVLGEDFVEMKYELINTYGSVVRTDRIVSSETQIETSDLQQGIYLLRLTREDGPAKSYRLVKN
ncbi:MAG: Ig-like domain-containing protein [Bacteroides sp.]